VYGTRLIGKTEEKKRWQEEREKGRVAKMTGTAEVERSMVKVDE
jgi:hypothetical protein